MILFIAKLLVKIFGGDLQKAQRIVVWSLAGIVGLVVVVAVVTTIRSCGSKPKLDQEQIEKAKDAIRKDDRKEMIQVLSESKVREQGIDNSIRAAEEATEKAKRDYSQLSNDELAAELERRLQQ